jgi:L-fuconolactonase
MRHLIHNENDPKWLLQARVIEGLKLLAENDLAFDVVAVSHEYLACVPALSEIVPGLRMVIDHLGQPPIQSGEFGQWGEDMKIAAANPNVYAKISGLGTASGMWETWSVEHIRPYVDFVLEVFGPDRCMVGGDWPVSVLAGGFGKAWRAYRDALSHYPTSVQEQVLSKTAISFYGLKI